MLPVGVLMIEHRLIERVIPAMEREIGRIDSGGGPDQTWVDNLVRFMREYADKCHHGKEEDILFIELGKKEMTPKLNRTMEELVAEHKRGRAMVGQLKKLGEHYSHGDEAVSGNLANLMRTISTFYIRHIEREDKRFFIQSMNYLDEEERRRMLERFCRFDKNLFDETYRSILHCL